MLRLAKRFAVLIPGVVIAYFSVRDIFPYFDRHVPYGLAIFITYVLAAYVLVPSLIRLFRILYPAKHLPLYCVTPDGFASDPLNIGVICTRRQLITAMEKSGWHQADPHHFKYLIRHLASTLFDWTYYNAPVSSLYLFGRKQDLAFQIPLKSGGGSRHHVRFWATTYELGKRINVRRIHWHHRKTHVQGDNLLWVGAASLDVGFGFIRHNLQITHSIAPDTNQERKLIVSQLEEQKLVQKAETINLGKPYRLVNRVLRGFFHADGNMTIVTLETKR